jgi:hypothetical protein
MTDLSRSIVRSITPIIVGFGASVLAHLGISQPAVVSAIGAAVAIAYGVTLRVLEQKYPKLGKLLGAMGAPTYPPKSPRLLIPAIEQAVEQVANTVGTNTPAPAKEAK